MLTQLFKPETRTDFEMVDTDTLRGHRTIVYEYVVKREFSKQTLKFQASIDSAPAETIVGYRGAFGSIAKIVACSGLRRFRPRFRLDFPISAASSVIDYDWVSINEVTHLLPSRAVIELNSHLGVQREQTRNDILFRGYRKFGTDVKIIDVDDSDFPPDKPEETEPPKPETPPLLKPAPLKKP